MSTIWVLVTRVRWWWWWWLPMLPPCGAGRKDRGRARGDALPAGRVLRAGAAAAACRAARSRGLGLLVVDGYVDLDPTGRPGLGAHAHAEFGVPVIGVAKTAFRTATHAMPVLRGRSARPLFVTARGVGSAPGPTCSRLGRASSAGSLR